MINKTTFLFILIISIFIFLFSLDVNAKEYELTPSQYHFTRIINGLPGVVRQQGDETALSRWNRLHVAANPGTMTI